MSEVWFHPLERRDLRRLPGDRRAAAGLFVCSLRDRPDGAAGLSRGELHAAVPTPVHSPASGVPSRPGLLLRRCAAGAPGPEAPVRRRIAGTDGGIAAPRRGEPAPDGGADAAAAGAGAGASGPGAAAAAGDVR